MLLEKRGWRLQRSGCGCRTCDGCWIIGSMTKSPAALSHRRKVKRSGADLFCSGVDKPLVGIRCDLSVQFSQWREFSVIDSLGWKLIIIYLLGTKRHSLNNKRAGFKSLFRSFKEDEMLIVSSRGGSNGNIYYSSKPCTLYKGMGGANTIMCSCISRSNI